MPGLRLRDETWARYRRLREDSRTRNDRKELTNDEFVTILLDVFEFHLELETDLEEV